MARFPSSLRSRRRSRIRNWIYVVSGLLIAGVVVAFLFGSHPFGKKEVQTGVGAIADNSGGVNEQPVSVLPEPEEVPAAPAEPAPEPVKEPEISVPAGPIAKPTAEAAKLISEAMDCINAKPSRIIEAREILTEVLLVPMGPQQQQFVKQQLSMLADKWLFSASVFASDRLCGSYRVEPGDQLTGIGQKHKVPYQILQVINNIEKPELLQAGKIIKVINGPFHAKVYRSSFTLDLYLQKTFVRSFRVGLGKPGMETPTGLWVVEPGGKLIKPIWTDPISHRTYRPTDSDYPLGSRWIGLEGVEGNALGRTGFAIHGTKDPEQIGTANSQGCIRMYNGDVILTYDLLMPGFSKVRVVE
jgi:hypothetical protein